MVKEIQRIYIDKERAWDDSILLQGKEKEKEKKNNKERKTPGSCVSSGHKFKKKPCGSVLRITPWPELAEGLAAIAL